MDTLRPLLLAAAVAGLTAQSPALAQLDPTPQPILPDLRYAAAIDLDGDGNDEIIGVSHVNDALAAYTLDQNGIPNFDRRLARVGSVETSIDNRWTLELADIDSDGHDDLVQADHDGVYIYYGRDNSEFDERVLVSPTGLRRSLTLLDFDADGDIDLLSLPNYSQGPRVIRWIENLGGGTFASTAVLASGADDYEHLQPVDIDGDGDLDLVGYRLPTRNPVVARNLGGSFQVEPIVGAIAGVSAIETEDLDNDGLAEILVRRDHPGGSLFDLYRGAPGGFLAPTTSLDSSDHYGGQMVFSNVDGAGGKELVCHTDEASSGETSIHVFEWSPGGLLQGPVEEVALPAGDYVVGPIRTADFNGDGKDDLVIRAGESAFHPQPTDPFGPRILRGAALVGMPALDGPFRLMEQRSRGVYSPEWPLIGDVDGDGIADVVQALRGELRWQRGSAGSARFSAPMRISDAEAVQLIADLDGDGLTEILLSVDPSSGAPSLGLIRSLGAGIFSPPLSITAASPSLNDVRFRAFDFDRDGDLDLFPVARSRDLVWVENLGHLTFASPVSIGISTPTAEPLFHAGDFDGDGDIDLLETSYFVVGTTELSWFEALGGGNFAQRQGLGYASSERLAVVDVNEDGIDDVVYTVALETFTLLGGPGGPGMVSGPVRLFGSLFRSSAVRMVDWNGDGLKDFVEVTNGASLPNAYLRTGPLAFDPVAIPLAPSPARLFDIGGDGDLDALVAGKRFSSLGDIDAIHERLDRGVSGVSYCGPAATNGSGSPASLLALGTSEAQLNELLLHATDTARFSFGFFLVSPASKPATPVVGSAGLLCLDGAIGRYVSPGQVQSTGATGSFQLGLDLTAIPTPLGPAAAIPGATWYFQAWFRDFGPSGPTSNFTDGVEVTFQ